MKIGLKLWSRNTDFYFNEAKRLHQDGWFDYIELYVVPGSLDALPKWQSLKIPFIIHNAHFMNGFNLAKRENRENNLQIYQETKRFADALGAERIVFHCGVDGAIEETARQLEFFKEPRALIENKPYRVLPNEMNGVLCRGSSPDEIKYVMRKSKCEFCLDFGHAICYSVSSGKDWKMVLGEFLSMSPSIFHLCDGFISEKDAHEHLGEGEFDLSYLSSLIATDQCVTLETKKNFPDALDDFVQDVEMLRRYARA